MKIDTIQFLMYSIFHFLILAIDDVIGKFNNISFLRLTVESFKVLTITKLQKKNINWLRHFPLFFEIDFKMGSVLSRINGSFYYALNWNSTYNKALPLCIFEKQIFLRHKKILATTKIPLLHCIFGVQVLSKNK